VLKNTRTWHRCHMRHHEDEADLAVGNARHAWRRPSLRAGNARHASLSKEAVVCRRCRRGPFLESRSLLALLHRARGGPLSNSWLLADHRRKHSCVAAGVSADNQNISVSPRDP